jgi:hypothetical protein
MILASTIDKHGMSASSDLKKDIADIIAKVKPNGIIETGTYLGLGTTTAVLEAMNKNKLKDTHFISIESNYNYHLQANLNLREYLDRFYYFRLWNMVSVPYGIIPTSIDNDFPPDVITDHVEPKQYLSEIDTTRPEDGIGSAMKICGYAPDIVILDSAGHMGTIEFNYLMTLIETDFILILDDTKHRKHYKTLKQIKEDPRFEILKESNEKFGYAICKFNQE